MPTWKRPKALLCPLFFDLRDKGIDVLAISVEDDLFARLEATGDIRDSKRSDPFGAACSSCLAMPAR